MTVNSDRIVISIDGLAATGKSSLAKGLASRLNYTHLNTGLLYRAIAQIIIDNALTTDDITRGNLLDKNLTLTLDKNDKDQICVKANCIINGINQSRILSLEQVQSEQTSKLASQIAVLPKVRSFLLPVQREAFPSMPIIAEGRDTGTVVFPNAKYKIFVEVPAQIRAFRRLVQLEPKATDLPKDIFDERIKQIEFDILERDKRDETRTYAPCVPAKDAKIYQNTRESLTQAIDDLYHLVSSSEGKL
jgi:cytidylate kinase